MTEPRSFVHSAPKALFVGVLVGGAIVASCQPGTLPCDSSPEWEAICGGSGGTSGGGGSSGSGGGGGMGGTTPPGNGGMTGTGVTAATAVMNCSAFPTLGEMDKFFAMRCGEGITCHSGGAFGDFKAPEVWKRLVGSPSKLATPCTGSPLIDGKDYTKGLFWIRTQAEPKCPDGKSAGSRMPSAPQMALNDSEAACLKSFLQVVAGQ
ncbi:MAG TPA: hypothetical protein VGG33_02750 [Polyangia bacterium]